MLDITNFRSCSRIVGACFPLSGLSHPFVHYTLQQTPNIPLIKYFGTSLPRQITTQRLLIRPSCLVPSLWLTTTSYGSPRFSLNANSSCGSGCGSGFWRMMCFKQGAWTMVSSALFAIKSKRRPHTCSWIALMLELCGTCWRNGRGMMVWRHNGFNLPLRLPGGAQG
jgi:hypothetical protein